ncbi:ABC transporter permease [Acidipila sp. 4G-K13]|nr:ABC transporter permease [Paracidobacterium acidisoli]MBT9330339.1 ABC transporter permease [Paracidobacterium acidisoli]
MLRFRGLFATGHSRRESDLAAELEAHLQMHIEDNLRAGMSEEEARRQAILRLGGIEQTKQAYHERATLPLLETFLHDLRFSVRQLAKNPGFAATAILTLALGICASVSIFAFVDAALVRPLPYPSPNTLVAVNESALNFPHGSLSWPDYVDWKRLNTSFRSLDVWGGSSSLIEMPAGVQPVPGLTVSAGFFRTLGVPPMLGRGFRDGEDAVGAPRNVVLSYSAWQSWFGGRRDIIGRSVTLSGVPHTIIGVMPRDFQFARRGRVDYWVTVQPDKGCAPRRICHFLDGMARLRDGVTLSSASANMKAIAAQLEKQYPASNRDQGASIRPLRESIVGDIRPVLLTLLCGAGLLLLIACVNVSSLLLLRSESRRREIAVRGALGASSARLARQFITEAFALIACATLLGLAAASLIMQLLLRLIPKDTLDNMPYLQGLTLNRHALAFTAAVALLALLLFSVTPMLRLLRVGAWFGRLLSLPIQPRTSLRDDLAEGTRGAGSTLWRHFGSNLVIVELAVAVVLLTGAGLLGRSFYRLLHVDLNFQPDHLAMLTVAASDAAYPKNTQSAALDRAVVDRMAVLPGVESAALTDLPVVTCNCNTDWIRVVGHPFHGEHNEVNDRTVSAGYFTTLHARLLRGRLFTAADDSTRPRVILINQAFAKSYFPGEDPIGKKIAAGDLDPKTVRTIVGVVDDVREGSLDSEIWPAEYTPFRQRPQNYFHVLVRTTQAPASILPAMAAALRRIDPGLGITDEITMEARIADSPSATMHRSSAWLVGGFAVLALLLSIIGLYGVIAYSVSQRTREIGVRMALGAQRATVYRLIFKEAAWLTLAGIVIGLACAVAAAGFMRSLLFGVHSWDIATLAAVAILLATAALSASWLPARRAASVNPVEALRAE